METLGKLERNKNSTSFLALPWEDVVFSHIFCYLSLSDIARIRRTNRAFNELCLTYFKCCNNLDCSPVSNRLTTGAFAQITKDSRCLKTLGCGNCKAFKDSTLVDIFRRNPNLISVNLDGCNSLTNQSLLTLAECAGNLIRVYLRECRWVSPAAVMKLAESCKMLEIVDLSGCWEVDDESLITLVMSCPKITHLHVNGCYGITDTLLNILSRQLPGLVRLELDGCWRVTNQAIKMIGEYCRKLRFLNVKDCRDISEASLARLRVKGVVINRKQELKTSQILMQHFGKTSMHMAPLRFDPT